VAHVQEGDIVTFIGREGENNILAVEIAELAGTITNELVSRLGSRLTKIYIG
jgi:alanine racemase